MRPTGLLVVLLSIIGSSTSQAGDAPSPERGRRALLGRAFVPAILTEAGYGELWKRWGVAQKPADYDRAVRERYGLHPAPYSNRHWPMGLRDAGGLFVRGIGEDCLLCHAGSIAGQSIIGLPNASLDLQGLMEDILAVSGVPEDPRYTFSQVRGTVEAVAAVAYLMDYRDADLHIRAPSQRSFRTSLCEDIPAWWLLSKKRTMYHTGAADVRAIRSLMTFMLSPLNSDRSIKKEEATFADIRAYLRTLSPPRYPFPIDGERAARGKEVFLRTCSKCHGTYGPDGSYPNRVIPVEQVDTDPSLAWSAGGEDADHYLQSWFGQERGPHGESYVALNRGYQAPPLDGIWATAPYFHNGSAPTVYDVLQSRSRPRIFTRSYRTEAEDYDPVKLGWKVTILPKAPGPDRPAGERRRVYDTTQPGRANTGHPFGDRLSNPDRLAVIEYLKTL